MSIRILIAAILLVLVSPHVLANAGKLSQIRLQQQEIREESERATGRYARFDRYELERMHRAQDRIFGLLEGVNDLSQLSADQQAELFNSIEQVKAVIAQNDADRQVCWREKKLGSQRMETHCATVEERAQVRQGARDWHGEPSVCMQTASGISCGRVSD